MFWGFRAFATTLQIVDYSLLRILWNQRALEIATTGIVPIEVEQEGVKMSIEEGLASTDADKVKAARRIAKGLVTKNINYVKIKLIVDNGK